MISGLLFWEQISENTFACDQIDMNPLKRFNIHLKNRPLYFNFWRNQVFLQKCVFKTDLTLWWGDSRNFPKASYYGWFKPTLPRIN